MSEKTKEVSQLADTTYAHTLVIKSTHEYKVHGPYGSNFPCTIGARASPRGPHKNPWCKPHVNPLQIPRWDLNGLHGPAHVDPTWAPHGLAIWDASPGVVPPSINNGPSLRALALYSTHDGSRQGSFSYVGGNRKK